MLVSYMQKYSNSNLKTLPHLEHMDNLKEYLFESDRWTDLSGALIRAQDRNGKVFMCFYLFVIFIDKSNNEIIYPV